MCKCLGPVRVRCCKYPLVALDQISFLLWIVNALSACLLLENSVIIENVRIFSVV